jgi:DNA topoisomerase I
VGTIEQLGSRQRRRRLRRADCTAPGITRRRRGRGFEYLDADGNRIEDPDVLQRIKDLVIPPAWEQVWICTDPMGHLQAVGVDAAGRKQYLYHARWRERRDQEKFDLMIDFARVLPDVRRVTDRHLLLEGMPRERALACSVRLLDRGFFRVGGESYAETNDSYGLATILKKHVRLEGREVVFEYVSKGGQERLHSVVDPAVFDVVAALKKRRSGGPELLAYKVNGRWQDVRSIDINLYLKELAGEEHSAKSFRTWHATVLAARALAVSTEALASKSARKRAITRACTEVAHYLGNTPAVCRKSYIDPRVIDRFESGVTIAPTLELLAREEHDELSLQRAFERAVLDLLEGDTSSDLVEKLRVRKAG